MDESTWTIRAMRSKSSSRGPPAERRILIIDDHPLMRQGLRALIDIEHDLTVHAEAATEQAALEALASTEFDLVILDLSLEDGDGLDLMKQIRAEYELLPILVLTMHDTPRYAQRALRAGANGYVTKGEMGDTLLLAIRRVIAGQ